MWQERREELHPLGLEVVTIALDVAEAARPWIEKANPRHPALIDELHTLDELFGVVNVPSGIWIDEAGTIVRPPEPAWPGRAVFRELMRKMGALPEDADPYILKSLAQTAKIKIDPARYLAALRDWAKNGSGSRFSLSREEVLARSRGRSIGESEAAAHFELGQHLRRDGDTEAAIEHFKEAHRLQPDNWTYKRQAWQYVSPLLQNARETYGTDWATEVEKSGPENYYPVPDL